MTPRTRPRRGMRSSCSMAWRGRDSERGLLTVIDATNLQRSARKPLLALAARFGRPRVAVLFDVPLERVARTQQRVARGSSRRMWSVVTTTQMATVGGDVPAEGYQLIVRA